MTVGGIPYFGQNNPDWHKSSRSHPASRFGDAGLNPFLTPKDTPLNSFADVRKRINDYDKKTAGDYFVESTAPWLARSVSGEVGQSLFSLSENNPLYEALPKTMTAWKDTHLSYEDIFGIEKTVLEKPTQMSWYSFLTNKAMQQEYKNTVISNFEGRTFNPISPSQYLKHVVMQYNLVRVAEDLEKGRLFPAMAKVFGIGTLVHDVVKNTRKHYQNAKAQEDGSLASRLKTLGKTAFGGAKEIVKSVAAWEVGSVGFMLGSSLICVGIIPSMVAGCIAGGLLETGFKSFFKYGSNDASHRQRSYKPPVQSQHVAQRVSHFGQTPLDLQA